MSENRHEANSNIIDQLQAQLERKQARITELESQLRAVALYNPEIPNEDAPPEPRALAFSIPRARSGAGLTAPKNQETLFRSEPPRIKLSQFGPTLPEIANLVFRSANAEERAVATVKDSTHIPNIQGPVEHAARFHEDESNLPIVQLPHNRVAWLIRNIDWRLVLLILGISAMAMSLRSLSHYAPFALGPGGSNANALFSVQAAQHRATTGGSQTPQGVQSPSKAAGIAVLPAYNHRRATSHVRKHRNRPAQTASGTVNITLPHRATAHMSYREYV